MEQHIYALSLIIEGATEKDIVIGLHHPLDGVTNP